ncbi:YlbL family protein [Corynebacterium glucuronolyticum]|uniref:YlbL family protein n=1 Tax=Corynebacterium glucuronolyticum TaxID=39791 RepID=UPI0021AE5D7A|nr:PDZ domain-containing protein [Corynebacterium glucuronolyticum]MCT1441959.1 PDZ domain-containing protein [Corynebacterium glucuronolyticum]
MFVKKLPSHVMWGTVTVLVLLVLVVATSVPGVTSATGLRVGVPFAAMGPGPSFDVLGKTDGGEDVVQIDGAPVDETDGQLRMLTVSVYTDLGLGDAIAMWFSKDRELVPLSSVIPPDVSQEDMEEANKQAFNNSESAATLAALNHLGIPLETIVAEVMEGAPADGLFEVEDVLTLVDDQSVTAPSTVSDYIATKAVGDTVTFTVRRGSEEKKIPVTVGEKDGKPYVGLLMKADPSGNLSVDYRLSDIGGSSAGMMFALGVIDKLDPGDTTKGINIAGTGTIDPDGEVGPIGGIKHKMTAAEEAGAQLFLAPADNCDEVVEKDPGQMTVAKVATLDEAIAAIDAYAAGQPVASCSAD